MKNLKTLFFALVLIAFVVNTINAQQKTKENVKEMAQEGKKQNAMKVDESQEAKMNDMFRKAKAEATTDEERAMIEQKRAAYLKSKGNNGNAYGKNKGELEGKEFGQDRAMSKKKLYQAYSKTKQSEATIEESTDQIKMAKERLDEAKKSQSISADEIAVKETKIKAAEKELKEAQVALENQKRLLKVSHESLDSDN